MVEAAGSERFVQSTLKRERKGISTLVTRNTTAASARLERVVVSAGLGPSQSSQLAREPTALLSGSVPRQCTWEGDCRGEEILQLVENLQVGPEWHVILLSRERKAAMVPEDWGSIDSCLDARGCMVRAGAM